MSYQPTEKQVAIAQQSQRYGDRFCLEHGPALATMLAGWKAGRTLEVTVRVYNRPASRMDTLPIATLFDAFEAAGAPTNLRPTPFGQVQIAPEMHVSTSIYLALICVWPRPSDQTPEGE